MVCYFVDFYGYGSHINSYFSAYNFFVCSVVIFPYLLWLMFVEILVFVVVVFLVLFYCTCVVCSSIYNIYLFGMLWGISGSFFFIYFEGVCVSVSVISH